MKKLLVILMLGAGFVTTASADPRDCSTDTTNNQCCTDVLAIQSALNQTPYYVQDEVNTNGTIARPISISLINDGTDANLVCITDARYVVNDQQYSTQEVLWQPGNWAQSIQLDD